MPTNEGFSGVSNCYVFKSRLQEYAQKAGVSTPVYETIKEGPSHEPSFRSTVIVNNVRYESLPGFFNRKAAEQSAAEVALLELAKHGEVNECIALPIHETGLCKNLLQEYAQKMNYAIPLYQCRKDEGPGRVHFTCTVEIGDIRYIGATASTKKEAEIKAARTALLAIRTSASELSSKPAGDSQLTVIPCKKRGSELANNPEETVNVPKAKKARFKKKMLKRKLSGGREEHALAQGLGSLVNMHIGQEGLKMEETCTSFQVMGTAHFTTEATTNCQEWRSDIVSMEIQSPDVRNALPRHTGDESENMHSPTSNCNQSINETPYMDTSYVPCGCTTAMMKEVIEAAPNVCTSSTSYGRTNALAREVNEATGVMDAASLMNGSVLDQIESSFVIPGSNQPEENLHVIPGLNQPEERIQAGTSQA